MFLCIQQQTLVRVRQPKNLNLWHKFKLIFTLDSLSVYVLTAATVVFGVSVSAFRFWLNIFPKFHLLFQVNK